jgi:ribosome-binding protein aMBF1 (putative translation factor)
MARYTSRNRELLTESQLPPEVRAAAESRRAERQAPAYQEGLARDIEAIRREFPPLTADESLLDFLATLRQLRERQGLSLTDVSERSRIDRATISKLETGKVANPTYATLRALAGALGKRLALGLEEDAEA